MRAASSISVDDVAAAIVLERQTASGWRLGKFRPMRLDQPFEQIERQAVSRHRLEQRRGHRISATPLLHAHLSTTSLHHCSRISPASGSFDDVPHARDFDVEGIERKQRAAMRRRRKQRGERAVLVRRPHQRFAIGECILHGDAA